MRTMRISLMRVLPILAATTALVAAAPAQAQSIGRWLPYLGCWEPMDDQRPLGDQLTVCISPVSGSEAIEIATYSRDEVVARERISATGARVPANKEGCNGWESARWSDDGRRVYLKSEYACDGGVRRNASGLLSFATMTEWLDVQVANVAGENAVRVVRYRSAPSNRMAPEALQSLLAQNAFAITTARSAAAAHLTVTDVIEASRNSDAPVVEAWLVERGDRFALDAKKLLTLADAGVPSSVIDIVVAVSFPNNFAIGNAGIESVREGRPNRADIYAYPGYEDEWRSWDPFYQYYRYRSFYSPFGYGDPYWWNPGYRPIVIVGGGGEVVDGKTTRVIKGKGYTQTPRSSGTSGSSNSGSSGNSSSGSSRSGSSASSGSTSSGSTGSASSGSSGGSSTTTTRTAKPRNGGGG